MFKSSLICFCSIAAAALVTRTAHANPEMGDAVYRDGVLYYIKGIGSVSYHTGIVYDFDPLKGAMPFVIDSDPMTGNPIEANWQPQSVKIRNWNTFLDGWTYQGHLIPRGDFNTPLRQLVVADALRQINASYWAIYRTLNIFYLDSDGTPGRRYWKYPNSSYQKGDGIFRCDGLVEWCYEQIGHNPTGDRNLFYGGPTYQFHHANLGWGVANPPTVHVSVALERSGIANVNDEFKQIPDLSHNSNAPTIITNAAFVNSSHPNLLIHVMANAQDDNCMAGTNALCQIGRAHV